MSAVQKTNAPKGDVTDNTENNGVNVNPPQQSTISGKRKPDSNSLASTLATRLARINAAQIKCLSVFSIFAIIGFGPVSPGCLIGMSIVALRPQWFLRLMDNMYANKPLPERACPTRTEAQTKQARIRCFLSLLGLFIIDIAPVPVTPVIAFGIILSRPLWFYRVVLNVYGRSKT